LFHMCLSGYYSRICCFFKPICKGNDKRFGFGCDEFDSKDRVDLASTDREGIFNNANDFVQVVRLEHHQFFRLNEILLAQGDNPGFIIIIFHVQNKVTLRNKDFFFRIGIHNASLASIRAVSILEIIA